MPLGLAGYAECTTELVAADAFLRLDHQVGGEEPVAERQLGVVQQRPGRAAAVGVAAGEGEEIGVALGGGVVGLVLTVLTRTSVSFNPSGKALLKAVLTNAGAPTTKVSILPLDVAAMDVASTLDPATSS